MDNIILSYYPTMDEAADEARRYASEQLDQVGVIRPILTILQPKGRLCSIQFPVAEDPDLRLENLRQASMLGTFALPFGYTFFIEASVSLKTPVNNEDSTQAIFVVVTNTKKCDLRILPYAIAEDGQITWGDLDLVEQDVEIIFNNPSLSAFLALNLFSDNPGIPWSTYRQYLEDNFFTFLYHAPFTEETFAINSRYML